MQKRILHTGTDRLRRVYPLRSCGSVAHESLKVGFGKAGRMHFVAYTEKLAETHDDGAPLVHFPTIRQAAQAS